MKIIHNPLLPPRRYDAVNILGLLLCRKGTTLTADLIQHERIHTAQMREMGFVGFYLWYLLEWLVRLPMKGTRRSTCRQEAARCFPFNG